MREADRIRKLLGSVPLKRVEARDSASLREQFQSLLPNILTEEDKQLLTSFFIYKCTGERLTGKDEERFMDLVRVDSIIGEEFLPSLVSTLRQMNKYMQFSGRVLTSEQLRQTLLSMVYDYRVELEERDLKIINTMSQNMFMTVADIAKQTNMDYKKVEYSKKKLEERCRLGVIPRLNYSKIGLTNVVILVEGEAYIESPYLLSRHEIWRGKLHTLFSIAVPSIVVAQVEKDFQNKFPELWVWIVKRFEASISFRFYDTKLKNWNIDWDSWSLYLSHTLSKCSDKTIHREKKIDPHKNEITPERGGKAITAEELKLIDTLLEKFDTPAHTLGESLGYSTGTAARAKQSLLDRGIIQTLLSIEHIGLSEGLLLIIESDTETLDSFLTAAKELPRAWIYWMEPLYRASNSSLACWLETPPRTINPFKRAIYQTLHPVADYKIFFRSKQEGSMYPLLELFDPQTETWRWSPEMLKTYLKKTE